MKPALLNSFEENSYDPFGMITFGRSWEAGSEYRYGFNGQMQDDEVYGNGNLNTAEYWEYDARLARRWNVDPLAPNYPFQSPYSVFNNNPIFFVDPNGLEGGPTTYEVQDNDNLTKIAKKYNTSIENIAKWNNLPNIDDIKIGQILIVSDPTTATYSSEGNTTDALPINDEIVNAAEDINGFLSITADAIVNLGGLEKAQELIENGKFEALYNGKTKTWTLKFQGNQYVEAEFVDASKSAFLSKATKNTSVLKHVKAAGVVFNIVGLGFTGADMLNNGVNVGNSADALFGAYAFIPGYGWIVSGMYFAIDQTIGWENAIKSYVETIKGFQESTGEKYLVPLMFKY